MAKNDSAKVTAGKPKVAGAINAAPVGTALPKNAKEALNAAFKGLGYVSEDGLTNSVETDSEEVKAWGGDTVLKLSTSRTETFSWTFIQALDEDVLAEVYGAANVTTSADGIKVLHNATELPRRSYVIEMLMTGGRIKRIVIPNAQITEVGEISYKDGEPVGFEVTLTAFPDTDGNTVTEYIAAAA